MLSEFDYQNKWAIISFGVIVTLLIPFMTFTLGVLAPVLCLILGVTGVFLIIIVRNPFIGLMALVVYCTIFMLFSRELQTSVNLSYVIEILYILVWIAIIIKSSRSDWNRVNNDLCLLFSIWFLVSVLELVNPAGPSFRGWVHEIRSSGLDSFVLIPAGFMLFRNVKHLNIFLIIIISLSLLANLNGIKQVHFGLFPGEREFLLSSPTHLIWNQIRVFSFYGDAGQFGASQAQLAIICGILAIGPFKLWKRIALLVLSCFFFYGMLISGTRGALFALVPGFFLAIFLFKNTKLLFAGLAGMLLFLAVLKYTHIGSGNYHIYRLRTALNPEDASLNVRFVSQKVLGEYLKDHPFGGGLGTIGYAGHKYNADKFLSTVEPDSYWVKVWAMYGIVGFVFWFCMMMYILGKSCGIVWTIKDKGLKVKLIALTSGFCGIFICSYGNEVINSTPSSIITYLSLVFIFIGPKLDDMISKKEFVKLK